MKKNISLGDIAREAGVTRSAVSYALRNSPGVSEATRKRILDISERLGYQPDARMASWMASVRNTKNKGLLPIAWLNTEYNTPSWRKLNYLSPFYKGAEERADVMGYRLEEIWTHAPGMNVKNISRILYQRGITGVIVTYPAGRFNLDWNLFAGVAIGGGLLSPRLHRVMADHYQNLLIALKMLKRHGYRRVGICLEEDVDKFTAHAIRAAANYFYTTSTKAHRVPPLFYVHKTDEEWQIAKEDIVKWIRKFKPEAIICHNFRMPEVIAEAGLRLPQDVGLVHLATDDDVEGWAGISSNKRVIGATAIDLLVGMMLNRQFGVPKHAVDTSIIGEWHEGNTLLLPNPAKS
ncbi:LacI family DNA-binding transcriptional regulator [Cerasicoccus fimbriatus]|uniref:LacI family DNA-binding transcriptional regulator n=1 Tax=Cerasicoccus fimbriatus TaxID=3014554 RepID=UPI0022B56ADB|nr:LacI family DNA-binding transcriptional regulator [Cerasicoccus sp. TK19100]